MSVKEIYNNISVSGEYGTAPESDAEAKAWLASHKKKLRFVYWRQVGQGRR